MNNSYGDQEIGQAGSEKNEWDVKLGGGLRVGPRYEGSSNYSVSPVPYLHVSWRDTVSLGIGGLNVNVLRDRDYVLGAGLTYHPGRDEKGNSFFGTDLFGSDDRLKGLGDIDAAVGARLFGSYILGPVTFRGSLTKYMGSQNDGVLIDLGMAAPFHLANNIILSPGVRTTWASNSYMDTFFGVTPLQSSRSGFPAFDADSGIKDVTAGLNAMYLLDRHWFVAADASIKQLMNDADRSPITEAGLSSTVGTVVGYHF
ncbi:MAG: MipA/OmpV family protein [Desulfobacteraceae bacterium]|nr:MipA/OmpV family protein [Desulfobacteraceae bacterium]